MDNQGMSRTISVHEMLELLKRCLWIMILAAILTVAALKAYSAWGITPLYQSRASLYILRRESEPDYVYTTSDFTLAKDVVNDCTYILKSPEVLEEVITRLKLDAAVSELSARITTYNPANTRFLEVFVKDESPEEAKRIVDCVCSVGAKKIADSMGFNQVNLYALGQVPTSTCNRIGNMRCLIVAVIVSALVYLLYLAHYLLDLSIRDAEDVEKYLGLTVIGEIPNVHSGARHSGNSKKYYSYYQSKQPSNTRKGGGKA